jgi:hypothetical protein
MPLSKVSMSLKIILKLSEVLPLLDLQNNLLFLHKFKKVLIQIMLMLKTKIVNRISGLDFQALTRISPVFLKI